MLFTFPSRYLFTIGRQLVFSLTRWSAQIHTRLHLYRVTQELPRRVRSFRLRAFHPLWSDFPFASPNCCTITLGPTTPGENPRFGLVRFRSPLLTESILFLFLRLLRCFTSPGMACPPLFYSERETGGLAPVGYPIRKSPGQSVCAAYRGLSQLSASFIACWHQGIHYVPALP